MNTLLWIALVGCGFPLDRPEIPAALVDCGPNAAAVFFLDVDRDGFGDATRSSTHCDIPEGYVAIPGDCNDADAEVHPDAVERCDDDEIDENCNGLVDDADEETDGRDEYWPDLDGDTFGDEAAPAQLWCHPPNDVVLDSTDCDDSDNLTFPGAADNDSSTSCMRDADGDGFGDIDVTGAITAGDDCDDGDDDIHPEAMEDWRDDIDQNCDGEDADGLDAPFDSATLNAYEWAQSGSIELVTDPVFAGNRSLKLHGIFSIAQTLEIDATACLDPIHWYFFLKRGPDAPEVTDELSLSWSGPNGWTEVWTTVGTGSTDTDFSLIHGVITDPDALSDDFRIALESSGGPNQASFFVDSLFVGCSGGDGDGDGLPSGRDCDDGNAMHWFDCGLCVDGDGDGYGVDCDFGDDCDDSDPNVLPGGIEISGDGVDSNCDGLDDNAMFDDFELGVADPLVWSALTGNAAVVSSESASGLYSLDLAGLVSTAETVVLDTSICTDILWTYLGKRGPESPDIGDHLDVDYWNGAGWVEVDSWGGDGGVDAAFSEHYGWIANPDAYRSDFRLRLVGDANFANGDNFFVDDFYLGCDPTDGDGDGVVDPIDCDPLSMDHWADCGVCVDTDGDGYGVSCDLGLDCDDGDPLINVPQPDLTVDGFDQDCNGIDGPVAMFDDFDTGALGPDWASSTGDYGVTSSEAYSGSFSLNMGGGGATLTTVAFDTSACSNVEWSYWGQRGPESPDAGDALVLEGSDVGGPWQLIDTWSGDGGTDPSFSFRTGSLGVTSSLELRLVSNGSGNGTDDFYIDNFAIACIP